MQSINICRLFGSMTIPVSVTSFDIFVQQAQATKLLWSQLCQTVAPLLV